MLGPAVGQGVAGASAAGRIPVHVEAPGDEHGAARRELGGRRPERDFHLDAHEGGIGGIIGGDREKLDEAQEYAESVISKAKGEA